MKKGEDPKLSAAWWKTNRGKFVKDVGLEKALTDYEKADRSLQVGRPTISKYDEVKESIKGLGTAIKKQIAACTSSISSGLQQETIDALKRYEPLLKKTWTDVEQAARYLEDRTAKLKEGYATARKEIRTADDKIRVAVAAAGRHLAAFPAACKKGKGRKTKAELVRITEQLEEQKELLQSKRDMLTQLNALSESLDVDKDRDYDALLLLRREALEECTEQQDEIRKALAAVSDAELDGKDAEYKKKRQEVTVAINKVARDVEQTLRAAQAETAKVAGIKTEKSAVKLIADVNAHAAVADRLRTEVQAARTDAREFDDDDDDAGGRAFAEAKVKLGTVQENVRTIEEVCRNNKRDITAKVAEFRRLEAELLKKQQEAARREEAIKAKVRELTAKVAKFVEHVTGQKKNLARFGAEADEHVKAKDYAMAATKLSLLKESFDELARKRRDALELSRNLAGLDLGGRAQTQQQAVLDKLTASMEDIYTKMQQKIETLAKIQEVRELM